MKQFLKYEKAVAKFSKTIEDAHKRAAKSKLRFKGDDYA